MTYTDPAPARRDTLTITLRKSVTLGETYTKLDLREPTVEQMIHWSDRTGVKRDIRAVATVAGVPEGAVRQIGARDFLAASRFIQSFELVGAPDEAPADERKIELREPGEWAGTVNVEAMLPAIATALSRQNSSGFRTASNALGIPHAAAAA